MLTPGELATGWVGGGCWGGLAFCRRGTFLLWKQVFLPGILSPSFRRAVCLTGCDACSQLWAAEWRERASG